MRPGPVVDIGSAGVGDYRPVLGVSGVFQVPEQGVAVADAVDEVYEGAQGGVPHELLGTQAHTDHVLGPLEGFIGDARHLGKCVHHLLLLVLLRHCSCLTANW